MHDAPDAMVMALLSEAGAYGSTLLLDHRPFVCDRLGRADIANKLFHWVFETGQRNVAKASLWIMS